MHSIQLFFGHMRALGFRLLSGHKLDNNDKQLRVSLLILERVPEGVRSG